MRLLVCGDRGWKDKQAVLRMMRAIHSEFRITHLIEGEAKGADTISKEVIFGRYEFENVEVLSFPADWKNKGRAAGPIRNSAMLDKGKPDLVLAFHDDIGSSKGTANMIGQARRRKIPVLLYSGQVEDKEND